MCDICLKKSGIPKNETGLQQRKFIHGELYDPFYGANIYRIEDEMQANVQKQLDTVNYKIIRWAENYVLNLRKSLREELAEVITEEDFDFDLKILAPLISAGVDFEKNFIQLKLTDISSNPPTLNQLSTRLGIDFNMKPDFTELILERQGYLKRTLQKTTLDKTQKVIREGVEAGKSFPDIAEDLRTSLGMSGVRSEIIARTETNWALNEGQREYMDSLGVTQYQISPAVTACPLCIEAAKKEYSISQKDVLPVHPNCRCTIISVIPREWYT